jgi:hypothetical protein
MHFLVTSISGRPGNEIYPRKDPGRSGQERSTLVRPFGRACAATRGDLRVCNATDDARGQEIAVSRFYCEKHHVGTLACSCRRGIPNFLATERAEAERLEDRRALRHRCAATEEQAAVSR